MLLTDARRPARTGPAGELVPLSEQDRTRWNRDMIREGVALVTAALRKGDAGEYRLQAAIAAAHGIASRVEDTDWKQIIALYRLLERRAGNPMVTLNRAIANAMAEGPAAGLALLEPLGERMGGHYRLDAVRAHLLERAGDTDAAIEHYIAAAARTTNLPEQLYLTTRAAHLRTPAEPGMVLGTAGGNGGQLYFWTPDKPESVHNMVLPNNARDLDLHPDARRIAIPFFDGAVRLYDLIV